MTSLLLDTGVRANQSGFGTASDGTTYSVARGAVTASIASNELQATGVTAETFVQAGSLTSADGEAQLRLSVSSTNYTVAGIVLRATSSTTYYRARINSNSSSLGIGITKVVSGTATTLASTSFTVATGTFYLLKFRLVGSQLYAKVWQDGTVEPNWQVSTSDTSITGAGNFGFVVATSSGSDIAKFDSLYYNDYATIEQLSSLVVEASSTGFANTNGTTTVTEQSAPSAEATTTSTPVSTHDATVSGGQNITNGVLPGQVNYNGVSNLIFGTNLANYSVNSQSLWGNTSVQQKLKQAKIQVVRCGLAHSGSNGNHGALFSHAEIDAQLAGIAACGAIPQIILPSNFGGSTTAFNLDAVTYIGNRCNLYEYSNEPDINPNGFSYTQYFNEWAAQVPNWRSANPNAAFGGPVLGVFSNLNSYLGNWLKLIKNDGRTSIIPNFVVIHIYPCTGGTQAQATCAAKAVSIGHAAATTQSLIQSIFNYSIPISISEWNVDANFAQTYRDNPAFAAQFFKDTITSFVQNNVAMAMQFEHILDYISPGAYYQPLVDATTQYLTGSASGGGGGTASATLTASPTSLSFQAVAGSATTTTSTTPGPKIYVPAYATPLDVNGTGSTWHQYEGTSGAVSYIICNPNSGPGSAQDSKFTNGIAAMHQAGIKVYGYVNTSNHTTLTALATVESQIDQWYSWYPQIDGIHFDTVLPTSGNLSYYTSLYTYVKGKSSSAVVVHNPSQWPPESYLSTPAVDIVGVFEDTYANLGKLQKPSPAYSGSYAASRFAATIVSMPVNTGNVDTTITAMNNLNIGNVYLTDSANPSPYVTPPNTTIWQETIAKCGKTTTTSNPNNPPSQNVTLNNPSTVAGSWSLSGLPTWATASVASGSLAANGSQTVTINVSQANLSNGTYQATVSFTMGNTVASVALTLTIAPTGTANAGITPLSVFLSAQASSLLSTANKLYPLTTGGAGGTPASTASYTLVDPSPGYGIIGSQNSQINWGAAGSLQAPSGLGFFLDTSSLQGRLVPAGTWSAVLRLNSSDTQYQVGAFTSDVIVRAYKYNSGTYSLIVTMSLLAQSITDNQTAYTFAAVSTTSPTAFGSGDYLYLELNGNMITALGDNELWLQLNRLSTDTVNLIGDTQAVVVTPGFLSGVSTALTEQLTSLTVEAVATGLNVGPTTFVTEPLALTVEAIASGASNIPTNAGYAILVNEIQVPIKEGSFELEDTLSSMSTCTFTVEDTAGNMVFTRGMKVRIYDLLNGLQYTGVVATIDRENFRPSTLIEATIATKDNHWFAEKRTFQGEDYANIKAGAIFADMVASLQGEGIVAPVATRRDSTQADFAQGTHVGTVATTNVGNGDVELVSAGSPVSYTESTTQDWIASGSVLSGTYYGTNNLLTLFPNNALRLQGTSAQGGNNNFTYLKIWAGNQVIASGDTLTYFLWISSTSPAIEAGVDGVFTDGSTIRDNINFLDQNGFQAHPKTDLSGYANDQRYKRMIDLSGYAGKTLAYVTVAFEGDNAGTYTAFFDTIQLLNGTTVKQSFYTSGTPPVVQLQNVGYSTVTLVPVTSYSNPGTRISPAYSLQGAGIVGSSQVNWVEELLTSPTATPELGTATGANKTSYVTVETSIDGQATWQLCSNHQPIPNLLPGQNLSGVSVYFRQTINVAGPDPTITPALQYCSVSVTPAYACTKQDVTYAVSQGTAGFNGTFNNTMSQPNGDLTLNSVLRNYTNGNISGQTLWGTGTPYGGEIGGTCQIGCTTSGSDVRYELNFAGSWSDFIMEVDVYINSYGDYGVCYRASNWANGNNTLNGYVAMVNTTSVYLGKSTSGGVFTTITNVSGLSLQAGVWHRLKVAVLGTNHRVYLDDVPYINSTDTTYASGYFGYRFYNTSGVQHSGFFNNFGVGTALVGTWQSKPISVASVGTVGNSVIAWNTATLPPSCTLTIAVSVDQITWVACTNNSPLPLPQLAIGQATSGLTLYVQATLVTSNMSVTPDLYGLSLTIMGHYVSSGTRVSPPLALDAVGTLGDSAFGVSANLPTGTTLGLDLSVDGGPWTNVTNMQGTASIPGLTGQAQPFIDQFTSVPVAGDYLSTYGNGGAASIWQGDYSNSRILASGGTLGLYIHFATTCADVDLLCDMDESDAGGLVWRYTDPNDYYELVVQDASSVGANPNTFSVYKLFGGTRTQLGSFYTIAFTRGTYHRIRVTMVGSVMTMYFDGVAVGTTTDTSLNSGSCGLRNSLSGLSRYYQLRVQPLGQSCAGHSVQMRQRLTSTNPQATPQVLSTLIAAYGPSIMSGSLIPQTDFVNKYFSDNFDELVKQCSANGGQWWWYFDKQKMPYFLPENGLPSPWVASDNPGDFLNSGVKISDQSDLYRNRSIITNVLAQTPIQESRLGDGASKSWTFGNQWASAPTITVNGTLATVGVKNVDTGKQFYYAVGDNTITEDSGGPLYDQTTTLTFSGVGQYLTKSQYDNVVEQQTLALIEGGTGIVEVVEDGTGLTKSQGDALAQSRVLQYGVRGQILTATTRRGGLQPGHLLPVFLPSLSIVATSFLISAIKTTLTSEYSTSQGTVIQQGWHEITGITGPNLLGWEQLYKRY